MMAKIGSVGVVLIGMGLAAPSANAQWVYWNPGCSSGYWVPAQPTQVQPAPAQTIAPAPPAPTAVTGQPAQPSLQAQSQTYQSFSATPSPAAAAPSSPVYNGYNYGGYYGNPYSYGGYGGSGYSGGWRQWDTAGYHGINPNAYP